MKAYKKLEQSKSELAEDSFRTSLIDAAERCYARIGIKTATMVDIAEEAGTSRRTLYRSFPSHEEILSAVVQRSVRRFWDRFDKNYNHIEDFCELLVEALIYTIKFAPKTKTHRVLFDPSMLPFVNDLYISNEAYVREQAIALDAAYQRTRHFPGTKQDLDMIMVCEWFDRLAVSFLATPSVFFRSETELRALFAVMFEPAIRETKPASTKPATKSKRLPRK